MKTNLHNLLRKDQKEEVHTPKTKRTDFSSKSVILKALNTNSNEKGINYMQKTEDIFVALIFLGYN